MIFVVGLMAVLIGLSINDIIRLRSDVRGLALRVADLDRDLTSLESSLTGDGK
jgi:hypothetical protein